ncbi:DUF2262 domain-containing protein [Rheinheimera sp. YQF-2]|uniref:DUF2262 domain-containing protein n=1 Tax=Rheinheimera lutimaris TaxID=2740584 RepID=A0A7Y5APB1_9GAMM|nr:DUF2262 domain-containing protein [Rheinheimera lutimaris]NRQ41619.1 DUF2262 domain-containing protein [Rheinheimera lutimaris]
MKAAPNPSLPLDKTIVDLLLLPMRVETDNCSTPLPGIIAHPQLGQLHYLLPQRIVHPVLGVLEYEPEYSRYNGKVAALEYQIDLSLTIDNSQQLDAMICYAAQVIRQIDALNDALRQQVRVYLSRFRSRQAWNDHYRISQADFDNSMQLQSLYFWSTELIDFYYKDKFSQHGAWFEVAADLDKQLLYISLQ